MKIDQHLDLCLNTSKQSETIVISSSKKRKSEDISLLPNKISKDKDETFSDLIQCPLCSKKLKPCDFNNHLDICVVH